MIPQHIIQLNNYCLNIDQDTIKQLQQNGKKLNMHSIEQVAIEHCPITIEQHIGLDQAGQAVARISTALCFALTRVNLLLFL